MPIWLILIVEGVEIRGIKSEDPVSVNWWWKEETIKFSH